MSIQKRAKLVPWLAGFAVLVLVAILAVPSMAATTTVNKLFTLDVAGPTQTLPPANYTTGGYTTSTAGTGDQMFRVRITNSTPGNSNFQSAIVSVPTSDGSPISIKTAVVDRPLSNNGNNNGANPIATISWLDTTNNNTPTCTKPSTLTTCPTVGVTMQTGKLYVQNIDPVKSANNLHQYITFDVTLTIGAVSGCSAVTATPNWSAIPINGNSLSGDTFAPTTPNSGLTTSISAQCGAITIQKYLDGNVNDTLDNTESLITDASWQFSVYAGTSAQGTPTVVSTATTATATTSQPAGTVSLTVPGGSYYICETDSKLSSTLWRSTDPDGCKAVTVTSGSTTTVNFGNKLGNLDCTGTIDSNGATITRGPNTDGNSTTCEIKPASLNYDVNAQTVSFLATGSDHATYTLVVPWGPLANTNPTPNFQDSVDLQYQNGQLVPFDHPLQWCDSPTGGSNNGENPVLPHTATTAEVACIVNRTWNIVDATHVAPTDTIYAEVDLIIKKT